MSKLAGKIKIEVKRLSVTDYKLKQNKKKTCFQSHIWIIKLLSPSRLFKLEDKNTHKHYWK